MNNSILPHSFAISAEGEIVSIQEVVRGLACDCTCSHCGDRLIARQGEVNTWCFAHQSGVECAGGAESALHKAAKEVIRREQKLFVPAVRFSEALPGVIEPLTDINIESRVTMENDYFQPDLVALTPREKIIVEIMVTHAVESDKLELIKRNGVAALEIYINPEQHMDWSWETLRRVVVGGGDSDPILNRVWLYHPMEELYTGPDLHSSNPVSRKPAPQISRYRLHGLPVNLKTYEWGLVLWHGYTPDRTLYIQIQKLVQRFGGRWSSKNKNWNLGSRPNADDVACALISLGATSG